MLQAAMERSGKRAPVPSTKPVHLRKPNQIMLKGTKLYSILNNKCPKCQVGDFFVYKNPFRKDFAKMHDHCPHCGELFNKEVGFYYGAMYVSYGLNIALGVGMFLFMVVILKLDLL